MGADRSGFWAELPLGRGVSLIARDANGLGALAKPEGILSHPNEPGDLPRSLLRAGYDEDDECFEGWGPPGDIRRLWLLNRLDSATSGVILVASNGELAGQIREHFRRKQVRKTYIALVFGAPAKAAETWRDRLEVVKRGGQVRTAPRGGNIPAECRMSREQVGKGEPRLSLLRLEPRTGRSHQLRVQCAKRGLPIVGDQTYGDFKANRAYAKAAGTKRLFLHSLETSFDYDYGGRIHAFSARAALPPEFAVEVKHCPGRH